MRSDEADFELTLAARASGAGAVERVTVLGRPAVLVPARGMAGWWTLLWRHDASDRVEVRIAPSTTLAPRDRPGFDKRVCGHGPRRHKA